MLNLLLLSLYYGHNDKPIISGCKMTLKVAKIAILAVFRGLYLKNRISKVVQIFFDGRLMSCEEKPTFCPGFRVNRFDMFREGELCRKSKSKIVEVVYYVDWSSLQLKAASWETPLMKYLYFRFGDINLN